MGVGGGYIPRHILMNINESLGKLCQSHRVKLNKTQFQVAIDLNCSKENVSKFELGKNDNVNIFLWYLLHGLHISEIVRLYNESK